MCPFPLFPPSSSCAPTEDHQLNGGKCITAINCCHCQPPSPSSSSSASPKQPTIAGQLRRLGNDVINFDKQQTFAACYAPKPDAYQFKKHLNFRNLNRSSLLGFIFRSSKWQEPFSRYLVQDFANAKCNRTYLCWKSSRMA